MSSPSTYHLFGWYVDGGRGIVKGAKKATRTQAVLLHWQCIGKG
jgi:hypothetical protein